MAVFSGPEIVNNGLVLHLDAANQRSYPGTGTVWNDLSGLGNNGTLVNGVGYSADNKGAMVFDGVNDYVNVPDNTSLQINNFTFTSWIYPKSNSTNGHIIRKEGCYLLYYGLWDSATGFGIWMQRTGGWENVKANITVPLNTWFNISATYDNSFVKIYYNSTEVGSVLKSGATRVNTNPVLINGVVSNSLPQNYNSSIVKIYNRALTAAEISQNFEATRSRYGI